MTTWFVTRHPGAKVWAEEEGIITNDATCEIVESLNQMDDIAHGDVVIGTLPIHLVAQIGERGGRYMHLAMSVPPEFRGKELSANDMRRFGCSVRSYAAFGTENTVLTRSADPGKTLHICLVSQQYMANLLPALKHRPAHIELVCTHKMNRALEQLGTALNHFGYNENQVSVHTLADACATDFAAARLEARKLRERLLAEYPGWHLILNATGSTKALAMAFFMEFQGATIIYADTDGGGLIRYLNNEKQDPVPMGNLMLSITDFLYCQGYKELDRSSPSWIANAERLQSVSNHLAQVMGNGSVVSNQLNTWRAKVEKLAFGPKKSIQFPPHVANALLAKAIAESPFTFKGKPSKTAAFLAQQGLLAAQEDTPNSYLFSTREAMDYLGGGWLEQWAWLQAKACGPHDLAANVVVHAALDAQDDNLDEDNELDLVVLHNNRLLIAECKTINWKGQGAKQEIFNKLDALGTHARGLFGQSLLVTAYPLDDRAKRRAEAYKIQTVLLSNLGELKTVIKKWMGTPPV